MLAEVHILEDNPSDGWEDEYLKLWAAVLYRGVIDYCKVIRKARTKRLSDEDVDTLEWFESDEIRIGSFAWVCQVLGYSAWYVRKKAQENIDFIATSRKLMTLKLGGGDCGDDDDK